jgi:hypothetical protein
MGGTVSAPSHFFPLLLEFKNNQPDRTEAVPPPNLNSEIGINRRFHRFHRFNVAYRRSIRPSHRKPVSPLTLQGGSNLCESAKSAVSNSEFGINQCNEAKALITHYFG